MAAPDDMFADAGDVPAAPKSGFFESLTSLSSSEEASQKRDPESDQHGSSRPAKKARQDSPSASSDKQQPQGTALKAAYSEDKGSRTAMEGG